MTLEQQAEIQYPMPFNPCYWTKRKIEYLRGLWVLENAPKKKGKG